MNSALQDLDVYTPIELRQHLNYSNKRKFRYLLTNLKEKGLPYTYKGSDIYLFLIPSKGSHEAVHFIWKQHKNEENATSEQLRLVHDIQSREVFYYNRDTKRELKKKLLLLGVMSSKHADVVMPDILGDNSAPVNEDAKTVWRDLIIL